MRPRTAGFARLLMPFIVLFGLTAFESDAFAQVQVSLIADGYTHVRFEARTGATGGSVEIPAGTVLSTGHNTTQELMLGVALKADLGPNERFSVRVETYCLQSSRTPPRQGALMSVVREAPANHRRVLAARSRFDQGDLQSAIWALADGLRHSNPVLDFVGVKAPVLRASRRQQPSTRQPNTTRVPSVLE